MRTTSIALCMELCLHRYNPGLNVRIDFSEDRRIPPLLFSSFHMVWGGRAIGASISYFSIKMINISLLDLHKIAITLLASMMWL